MIKYYKRSDAEFGLPNTMTYDNKIMFEVGTVLGWLPWSVVENCVLQCLPRRI